MEPCLPDSIVCSRCSLTHGSFIFALNPQNKWSRTVLGHLQRPAQMALVVRHGLKLAFHLEHRDRTAAMKQYMSTYNDLCEFAATVGADRHPELKAIAEVLNLKTCLILMQIVSIPEAQTQLLRHVATWRFCRGPDGALFLHQAWLARQHAAFAQLLDEAAPSAAAALTPLTRPLSSTNNSAMHWETAAALVGARRVDAAAQRSLPPPTPGDAASGVQFWGQPVSGRERYSPSDVHQAWLAEREVQHGEIVLELVRRAMLSNSAAGSQRRVCSLKVAQAKALFELGKLEESKQVVYVLLEPTSPIIRDGWQLLEAEVLELLLELSRVLRDLVDFVSCSLRLIDSKMPFPQHKKKSLQDDLGLQHQRRIWLCLSHPHLLPTLPRASTG